MYCKLIFTIIFLITSIVVKSQTFNITDRNGYTDEVIVKYQSALNGADLEKFRGKTITKTFEFTNGIKFTLISAKELFISGKSIDLNLYKDERPESYREPVFFLTDTGYLLAQYKKLEKQ